MIKFLKKSFKKTKGIYRIYVALNALVYGLLALSKGKTGSKEHVKSSLSLLFASPRAWGRPVNVTIEPTTFCNLECPVCETGNNTLGRPRSNMNIETFRSIIDVLTPHINYMLFYYMGEPFINVHSYDMISYAKQKGVKYITTCTNGDVVNPRKLVESGIDEVHFQIGGMTQETHEQYRKNSNLERVMFNLSETLRLRNELKRTIVVRGGLIVMRHNEHEIVTFLDTMKKIGVDKIRIQNPCVRTQQQAIEMLPTQRQYWDYDEAELEKGNIVPLAQPYNICPYIYYAITVTVNGDVVSCCRDPHCKFIMGNLLKQSMDAVWNGNKFREFRKNIFINQKNISMCSVCSGYGSGTLY
jgi:radical SAM protein with 4Fe4S-binding SPASM domain